MALQTVLQQDVGQIYFNGQFMPSLANLNQTAQYTGQYAGTPTLQKLIQEGTMTGM